MNKEKRLPVLFGVLRLLMKYEPSYLPWAAFQILTGSLLPLIAVYFPKRIIETLTDGGAFKNTVTVIVFYSTVILLLTAFDNFLSGKSELAASRFSENLRFEIGKITMRLEMKDIESASQKKIIQMAGNGAGLVGMLGTLRQMASNIITVIGLSWIIFKLSAVLLIVIAVLISAKILIIYLQFRYDRQRRELYAENNRTGDYLTGLAYFNHGAEKEIRVYDLQKWFMGKVLKYRGEMLHLQYRDFRRYAVSECIMAVLVAVQSLTVLLILSESYIKGAISIADFTMYFSGVTTLVSALTSFTYQVRNYREQVLNFTDHQKLIDLISTSKTDDKNTSADIHAPIRIVFENVSFAYPGSDRTVLKNIYLTISGGEKLMIAGLNGSGKTTLIKLLCKLYRPTHGKITVNGRDIWKIPNEEYYRLIGAVFQDYKNFAFTLAENIGLCERCDGDRIIGILEELGMSDALKNSSKGIDTNLTRQFDPEGTELSGGQDQKLAIARAIYKNAPILILDEPTASLDAKAESDIYADFARISHGKTAVFISHRLASSTLADRIAVFDNGAITEYGTHDELIAKGGLYAQMYEKQSYPYVEGKSV